jgi:hypothetical protein
VRCNLSAKPQKDHFYLIRKQLPSNVMKKDPGFMLLRSQSADKTQALHEMVGWCVYVFIIQS